MNLENNNNEEIEKRDDIPTNSNLDKGVITDDLKKMATKKIKRWVKVWAAYTASSLLSVVLLAGILQELVKPISEVVGGVIVAGKTVVKAGTNFIEKTKNLFVYGYFKGNEEVLLEEVLKAAIKYEQKNKRPLNIPLVASTVYYDGEEENTVILYVKEKEELVKRVTNKKLKNRLRYLDDIIERMYSVKEFKYRCDYKLMEAGKGSYEMTLVEQNFVLEPDESKEGRSCNENTLTGNSKSDDDHIFVYETVYTEEAYAYRLKNDLMQDGHSLIFHLYEKELENSNEDTIINEILDYYKIWVYIYGEVDVLGDCYFPGSLNQEVIESFTPPIRGGYRITSRFGLREDPFGDSTNLKPHRGIDLVPTSGNNNIYAVADGTVVVNTFDSLAGNYITIQHLVNGTTYYTQYMHMQDLSSATVGSKVLKGDVIGKVGNTGKSTGAHLHFGVYTSEGERDYKDPENLLAGAENYNFVCIDPGELLVRSCSVEGAAAMYALDENKSFNLVRAILNEDKNRLLYLDFDISEVEKLYDSNQTKYDVYFDNFTINIDGELFPFRNPYRDYVARSTLIESIGEYNPSVYDKISIGFSNFSSSLYNQYGYSSSKEMYEVFKNNPVEYVTKVFTHIINSESYVEEIFNTIEITGGATYTVLHGETKESIAEKLGILPHHLLAKEELDSNIKEGNRIRITNKAAITGVLKSTFKNVPEDSIFNRYKNDSSYVDRVISNFEIFYNTDSSTIENYIGQCLYVPKPDWEDCITWENNKNCQNNIKTHKAAANYFLKKAPTVAGKKVLSYGLSLWGKVRYCGACDLSDPECNFINPNTGRIAKHAHKYSYSGIRCSPWGRSWSKEGFNPKWEELHTYYFQGTPYYKNREDYENNVISYKPNGGTFTAAIAGLDCDGFVNWTLNQAFREFNNKTFPVMSTVCNGETKYTYSTRFDSIEGYERKKGANFGNSILPRLTPGDVICNSDSEKFGSTSQLSDPTYNYSGGSRHVMFYMGFEDANGNLIADAEDYVYVLHSSTYGVRVDKIPAKNDSWLQYSTFASYK